jgi:2-succinyl-5-enolpyruvyl-6-hydroxy-3-cyclohexene-1-carboxylate synthase
VTSPAQVLAANLLAQLVANGVDHIFLAPGARSQALAIAAGQLASAGHVQLHVRLDERSMAFQALGVGLSSGFPAALITTSGTAVANLHPAVLEAHHAGVPMILLTADRPAELRGVGANQTTNQVGIFGEAVRECIDVPAPTETDSAESLVSLASDLALDAIATAVNQPGPVQLNLCFREPLSAAEPDAAQIFDSAIADLDDANSEHVHDEDCDHDGSHQHEMTEPAGEPDSVIDLNLKTVVIAGDGGYLARWYTTGLPLLAEPSSGVRGLPEAIAGYLWLLESRTDLVQQVQQVLVFGKPTLSRQIQALLKRPGLRILTDPGRHGVFNPTGMATPLGDDIEFVGEPDRAWLKSWQAAGSELLAAQPNSAPAQGVSRRQLVEAVYSAARKTTPILLGASRLIREADRWAPMKERTVFANRGLAGIDGTIATATGIAMTHTGAKVRVLLGDLTLLHDASSLVIDPIDANLNIQLIVGNDGGGTIFEGLEVAKNLPKDAFEKLFYTPQRVNLALLAGAYGWAYERVTSLGQLELALKSAGHILIDVELA